MKVFGKWLVMAKVDGKHEKVAASFMRKADAVEALKRTGFDRVSKYIWEDGSGQLFYINKNVKEYR